MSQQFDALGRPMFCAACGAPSSQAIEYCEACDEIMKKRRDNRLMIGWAVAFLMFLSVFAYAGHVLLASAFSGVLIFFGLCVISLIIIRDIGRQYFESPRVRTRGAD